MTEPSPSSRFQVLETPLASPGKCMVCGAVDRPVVDFGADIQWYGVPYLCGQCIREAATYFNMVPREELQAAEKEAAQSFVEFLSDNDLVAVSGGWYKLAVTLFGSVPVIDANSLVDSDDVSTESTGEADTGEPETSDGSDEPESSDEFSSIFGTEPDAGQDGHSTIDEGPISVPAGSSNERSGIELIL